MKQEYTIDEDSDYWINFAYWSLNQNAGIVNSQSMWDKHKNMLLMDRLLKKFNGRLIYEQDSSYNCKVIVGVRFRSAEDLVHFKLKFT